MNALDRFSRELSKVLYHVAGASIVFMMLLTCVDVLLRFGVTAYRSTGWGILESVRPIAGTYELVCFMGSVAVAFAMAHTSVEKGHVAVSLLVRLLSRRVQAVIQVITGSFSFILFALISWRSVLYALHLRESGEVSLTLQLPFYPFVFGIAFASAAVCLVLFVDIASGLGKVKVT
ncbi:MAG: TRAP transporter small permease [Deltaproteobacteria bacterium]|nr:TRAP transporter small permease [Deltaproteobacteria bacterium]MBW1817141.1 TRAP transporter small permease [Deltaproteobacteria bacterium]MBW2284577.1 TRAP transporter small permease [Deltaproteobacteria bacterium]